MCDRRTLVEQVTGKLWINVKKLLGSQKYEVKTERNGGGVRGTIFSIEITNDEEIIKVYEGSFEVYPPKKDLTFDAEFEKLTKEKNNKVYLFDPELENIHDVTGQDFLYAKELIKKS